jgi:hypothetical protein
LKEKTMKNNSLLILAVVAIATGGCAWDQIISGPQPARQRNGARRWPAAKAMPAPS